MRFLQVALIGFFAWIVVGGDMIWESLWPHKFWKKQVAELEACAKKDLWHLKSVEWELTKGRIELTVAVSAAEDKGQCLGVDCRSFVAKAKEEASLQLHKLIAQESKARLAYGETLKRLDHAKEVLAGYEQRLEESRVDSAL